LADVVCTRDLLNVCHKFPPEPPIAIVRCDREGTQQTLRAEALKRNDPNNPLSIFEYPDLRFIDICDVRCREPSRLEQRQDCR